MIRPCVPMPPSLFRRIALAVLLALAAGLSSAADCERTVRWKDDHPYSFRDTAGAIKGVYADLVSEALKRVGCSAHFVEMPWARALNELEAGRLDILPGSLKTPEREAFAHFSRAVNRSPNVLFMSKAASEKFQPNKLTDLVNSDFRLGVQIKVSYGPEFDILQSNSAFVAKTSPITDRRSGWKMLEADRIDGLIADEITGLIELRQLGLEPVIVKSRVVVSGEPAMIAFSKQTVTRDFVDRFNKALDTMMSDGTYVAIKQRYVPCKTSVVTLGCR